MHQPHPHSDQLLGRAMNHVDRAMRMDKLGPSDRRRLLR